VSSSVGGIAIAHKVAVLVDRKRLAVGAAQRADIGRIAVGIEECMERVVACAMPANDPGRCVQTSS
jgi:hypothetical protein